MALGLKDTQTNVECGLGIWTYIAALTSPYALSVQSSEIPPSGLSIVINQNGSPIASSSAIATTVQSVLDLQVIAECTAGDTITFVLTSSAPQDLLPNSIKSIIKVSQGLV